MFKRFISLVILHVFFLTSVISPDLAYSQAVSLPQPGTMLSSTPAFAPALLRGLVLSSDDPLKFDFIVNAGDEPLSAQALEQESRRMVNYFLAALTVPQKDLWVNLSPVEKDRIIPDELIRTELGRDLLAQDYILKQLTASLIYPEEGLGKAFWQRIYDEAYQKFGVTDVPVDVFNKVWIVPQTASVFEKGNAVYVTKAHLQVMLEADYLAQGGRPEVAPTPTTELTKSILREVIVPAIEKEVNEGKHFARLRQIVHAMVLAQWYQDVLKEGILNKAYSGQSKMAGIDLGDPANKELIYAQYMAAYKKGVFSYIKEETDRLTQEPVAKKYFSGGFQAQKIAREQADPSTLDAAQDNVRVSVRLEASEIQPKAFYDGAWNQVINKELKKYLYNLQNPDANKVVSDVSLEAFIDFFLGKGGLGFLASETWGAYSDLLHWKAMGVMPLYSFDKDGNKIDWDNKAGFQPVYVQDERGRQSTLSFDVEFKGQKERVYIYWYNANGTPVFLIKHASLFRRLYPGGDEQVIQYGFLGRAYVELMKVLGISPDILRLSESQLLFVATAMKNDIEFHRSLDKKSVLENTKVVMTTHTPELAALPSWDNVGALKSLVGDDLVREDIIYAGKVNAAGALGTYSDMVNGVSPEHKDITIEAVLPHVADKTTGIQNGSDPELWRSEPLNMRVLEEGIAHITGKELFDIGMVQKQKLNAYLKGNGYDGFVDIERPLFAAVRRLVEYKSQAILIPMVKWIVGDPEKDYETPLGVQKGLGANLLLGGEALDGVTFQWVNEFKRLEQDPEVKGRFIMAERTTGVEFMQLATSGADGWLVLPWMTREASGTSDQRAGFNGHLVIATATGGPVEWIDHGVNGWLVTPFNFEHLKRNKEHAAEFRKIIWAFQNKEIWALSRFYEEGRRQFAAYMRELVDMYQEPGRVRLYKAMEGSFQAAHRRVSIHRMIQEYGLMFDAVLDGVGVKGFEERLEAFAQKWESGKLWHKDAHALVFDVPQEGEQVPVQITLDGNEPLTVSFRKGTASSGWEVVTEEGNFPVKDKSDIYVVRTNDQSRVTLTPKSVEFPEAVRLRFQVDAVTGIRLSVVRSGFSPVKLSKDSAERTGGIDVRRITLDRQGKGVNDVLSSKALEDRLMSAPGVRGVIVGMSPIADLPRFLEAR